MFRFQKEPRNYEKKTRKEKKVMKTRASKSEHQLLEDKTANWISFGRNKKEGGHVITAADIQVTKKIRLINFQNFRKIIFSLNSH